MIILFMQEKLFRYALILLLFITACESSKSTETKYALTPDKDFVVLLQKEKTTSEVDSSIFFPQPLGVISDKKNGNIYVASTSDHQIYVLGKDLTALDTIGTFGQGPGELRTPAFLEIHDKELYVVEWGNNRISCFTLEGRFVKTVKPEASLRGTNIAIDSQDRIYVFDPASKHLISVLKDNGEIAFSFGDLMDREGYNIINLNRPLLCIDEFDNIYVVFIAQYTIRKYNKDFVLEWERDYSDFPAFLSYQQHILELEQSGILTSGQKTEGKRIPNTSYFALAHDCVYLNGKLYVIYAGHEPHGYGIYAIDTLEGKIKNVYLFSHKAYSEKMYLITNFCFSYDGKIIGVERRDGYVILFDFNSSKNNSDHHTSKMDIIEER